MQFGSPPVPGSKQIIGLTLYSYPNVVTYSFRGNVLNGLLSGNNKPEIKIPGNNQGAKSFVLKRVRFGCLTSTGQAFGNVPTACTLSAAFSRGGIAIKTVLLTFNPPPTDPHPYVALFNFPTDIGPVDSVVFSTDVSNATPILTAAVLDDFGVVIYK